MRTLLIALASALLLAYLITELTARVWPNSAIALFALAFVLLFINGIFNAKLSGPSPQVQRTDRRGRGAKSAQDSQTRQKGRSQRDRNDRKPAPRAANSNSNANANANANANGPKENGTVKWYNRSKGYGFIVRENGEEIFVHQRSIVTNNGQRGALRDGQAVSFTVTKHDKGLQAENVSGSD